MAKRRQVKLSKKELKYRTRMELIRRDSPESPEQVKDDTPKKTIQVPTVVPVRHLSDISGVSTTAIIQALFKNGVMATINESIDFETAILIGEELGLDIVSEKTDTEKKEKKNSGATRPPIVTIMGHVDHGKTKLLDTIRQTNVVASESGGITQHIGAYQVEIEHEKKKRKITFLDTPGHEAFSALRAHGANVTDIVVLVVAADDGVKAQTLEAISHAKAAQVPIIIAINKIDLPAADPDRVKRELAEQQLLVEDWGGNVPCVHVSAKSGTNIKNLLDIILLVADMHDLKADAKANPSGTVIESHVDSGVGIVATVLVSEGTLIPGQFVVIGNSWARIRFLENWRGQRVSEALPAMPVKIAGLKNVPGFGDTFKVVNDEKTAKNMAGTQESQKTVRSVSEQALATNEFRIIIKADVVGSLEAIKASLHDFSQEKVRIKTLFEGIGSVTDSDVNLAMTAGAFIFSFRVDVPKNVINLAERQGVIVRKYDTIYKLIEELKETIEGNLSPEITEDVQGELTILRVFFQVKDSAVVGGKVTRGEMSPQLKVKIFRGEESVGEGKITDLKIGPSSVDKVGKNDECGLQIIKQSGGESGFKLKEGDLVQAYLVTKKEVKL